MMDLSLCVADDSIESPSFLRAFLEEAIFEQHLKHATFLKEEEIALAHPNTAGEITIGEKKAFKKRDQIKVLSSILKMLTGKKSKQHPRTLLDEYLVTSNKIEDRERDPHALKAVLQKIEQELIAQADRLPLVHTLYETAALEEAILYLEIDGISCDVEGDLHYEEVYGPALRNKIQIKSYLEDYGKVDFYVQAAPTVMINQQTYFCVSSTKAEQFAPAFQRCYDFLDLAIAANKKVLWEFWN